uniref:Putative peptidase n=1 Tax=viral metagenome TaxID=1070528 RepID=A0A6M3J1V9_9ZZZZ
MILQPIQSKITQYFGENPGQYGYDKNGHKGLDFRAPLGTAVVAGSTGVATIRDSGSQGFGLHVLIHCGQTELTAPGLRMSGDITLIYGHLSQGLEGVPSPELRSVKAGAVLALSGNSGNSTAPHLHFEIRIDGEAIDPLPFLERGAVTSKYGFQIQKPNYPAWLLQHVARSKCRWVKIINPDYGRASPFGTSMQYLGRFHCGLGEPDKELMWRGSAGADAYWAMIKPRVDVCPWLYAIEGPNEPAVDTIAKAQLFSDFYSRLCDIFHAAGKRIAAGVFSTGQPDPALWPYLHRGIVKADYVALHEYGMHRMVLDGWHLLRYRKLIEWAEQARVAIPLILITETGIDYAGDPINDGWQAQGISSTEYLRQLVSYDIATQEDPEVLALLPFVWMHDGWPSFEMNEEISRQLADYMSKWASESVEEAIGQDAQRVVLPLNPNAAFEKAGTLKGYLPASPETDLVYGGVTYRYQVYRHPSERTYQHIIYCPVGHWGDVKWIRRSN